LIETRVDLGLGDILLLYTDGLTEESPPGWTDAQLHDRVRTCPTDDLDALLAELESLAVSEAAGRPRDDIALLALRPTDDRGSADAVTASEAGPVT
jgi:serine phosphatase RsbU (regulator of sigma subunit)